MDNPFELPIHISYHPPRWLITTLMISHAGAIICVLVITVPYWVKLIIIITVVLSLFRHLRNHRNSGSATPLQLLLNSEGEWKMVDEKGDRYVRMLPGAFVHPALVVLRFQDHASVLPVVLTPETVDKKIFRRLRVRLRFNNVRGEED